MGSSHFTNSTSHTAALPPGRGGRRIAILLSVAKASARMCAAHDRAVVSGCAEEGERLRAPVRTSDRCARLGAWFDDTPWRGLSSPCRLSPRHDLLRDLVSGRRG